MQVHNDDYMIGMSGEKLDNVVKWVETIGNKIPPFTITTKKGSFSFGEGQANTNTVPITQIDSTSIKPYTPKAEQWYESPIVLIGGAVAILGTILLISRR